MLSSADERTRERAKVLCLANMWGEPKSDARESSLQRAKMALAIFRELGDESGIAQGLGILAQELETPQEVLAVREERLAMSRKVGDKWMITDALNNLGWSAVRAGEYSKARPMLEESLVLAREVGDRVLIGDVLFSLGFWWADRADYETGKTLFFERLELCKQLGFNDGVASAANMLAMMALFHGDYPTAQSYAQESIRRFEELGSETVLTVIGLGVLGLVAMHKHEDLTLAGKYIEKAQTLALSLQGKNALGYSHTYMGHLALHQGRLDNAAIHLRAALDYFFQAGLIVDSARLVHELGLVSAQRALRDRDLNHAKRAARLFGAAEAAHERTNLWLNTYMLVDRESSLPTLRDQLGEKVLKEIWNEGRLFTLEQAIELALSET